MDIIHLSAAIISILFYLLLAISYFGWGHVFIYFFFKRDGSLVESTLISVNIWVGWACTLLLFQLVHFFLPLTVYSVSPIIAFGVLLSLLFVINKTIYSLIPWPQSYIKKLLVIIFSILVLSWIASRSMLSPTHFDSGLYHYNIIRWLNSYPIIPGLGNLHGRLAFNQSFFTYVAALNLHPFFGHGKSIANSFLFILTMLTAFETTVPAVRNLVCKKEIPHPKSWVAGLFCLPVLLYFALTSEGFYSPSPDLTSSLMQLTILVMFARTIADFDRNGILLPYESFATFILAATAITIKLSNIVFSVVVMAWILFVTMQQKTSWKYVRLVLLIVSALLILSTFCIRGVLLSGAPLFPSTIGYVDAEWSVPIEKIIEEKNWIYSWARQPDVHMNKVLGSWSWLSSWLQMISLRLTTILYPASLFIFLGVINTLAFLFLKSHYKKKIFLDIVLLTPLVAGLLFWFFTAPDPRFASALFFLLPICMSLIFLSLIQKNVNRNLFAIIIILLFVGVNIHLLGWLGKNMKNLKNISVTGWEPVMEEPLQLKSTRYGLQVYTPVDPKKDQCWDSPLMCTPNYRFNENLRLRNPSDITSGFVSDTSYLD